MSSGFGIMSFGEITPTLIIVTRESPGKIGHEVCGLAQCTNDVLFGVGSKDVLYSLNQSAVAIADFNIVELERFFPEVERVVFGKKLREIAMAEPRVGVTVPPRPCGVPESTGVDVQRQRHLAVPERLHDDARAEHHQAITTSAVIRLRR